MPKSRICSIPGCEKPYFGRGFCQNHRRSLVLYGDPLILKRPKGRLCEVEGCSRPHRCNGFCTMHYARNKNHGDPSFKRPTIKDLIDQEVIPYSGTDCYFLAGSGRKRYFCINVDGKLIGAHRYVCQKVHGDPPTLKHLACHRCGNGQLGCLAPNCLYWGTYKDNSADSIRHGTKPRGEAIPWVKLTETDVREIRLLQGYIKPAKIGQMYNVARETVNAIHRRRIWKHVKD